LCSIRTFVAAVEIPDLVPAVFDDDVSQSSRVLWPHVQLVGDLLAAGVDRHAGRHERHPESGAVRLDRVERVGHVSGVERKDASRHHLTYCNAPTYRPSWQLSCRRDHHHHRENARKLQCTSVRKLSVSVIIIYYHISSVYYFFVYIQ